MCAVSGPSLPQISAFRASARPGLKLTSPQAHPLCLETSLETTTHQNTPSGGAVVVPPRFLALLPHAAWPGPE